MFDKDLLTSFSGSEGRDTDLGVRARFELPDMRQMRINYSLTKNIQDAFNGMNGSAVICKARLNCFIASINEQPKRWD